MILAPVQPRSALIIPFLGSGLTQSGIYVDFDRRLPPVLGRVIAVSPDCRALRPGQVVVFRPYAYEEAESSAGTIFALSENAVAGILDGYDQPQKDTQ